MSRVTAIFTGLAMCAALAAPAPSANAQDIAFDFTYASSYYWRGAAAGSGNGFMQPSADLSYAVTPELGVGLNIWLSQGPGIVGLEAGPLDGLDNNEIDYTVSASYGLGDIGIYAGVIDYVIPIGAPFADGHVLEAHIGADFAADDLGIGIAAYMNLDGDDEDSMYIAPSLSYPLGNLSLGLSLGLGNGFYSEEELGEEDALALVDITPSVGYSIPLGDDLEAAVGLAVGYNPNADTILPFFTLSTGWNWSP